MFNVFTRFEKPISSRIDVVNSLLQINNSKIVRPRDRSLEAENRRQIEFDASTNRVSSQFEMIEMKTAEMIDPAIERVIQRADPAPGRRRRGRRGREGRAERAGRAGRAGRGRGRGGGDAINHDDINDGDRENEGRDIEDVIIRARRRRQADVAASTSSS
jgi:hypothetical protein